MVRLCIKSRQTNDVKLPNKVRVLYLCLVSRYLQFVLEAIKLFTMSRDLFRLNKKFLLEVDMNRRLFLEDLLQCKRITHRND